MELEWDIPSTWEVVPLKDLASEYSSQILPADYPDTLFNYWGLDTIQKGQFEEPAPNYVPGRMIRSTCIQFDNTHILYAKLRPYLNKVIVPTMAGIGSTEWIVLKPNCKLVDRKYLAYVLRTRKFVEYASANTTGTRMPRLKKDALWKAKIPIPYPKDPDRSLAEQRRIVARLEALLGEVRAMRAEIRAMREDVERLMEAVLEGVFPPYGQELPDGWEWRDFPSVCTINPKRPKITRGDSEPTSFVPMEAVDEKEGKIVSIRVRPFSEVRQGYTYFEENDVLMAKITPSMENGKAAIARGLIGGFGFGSTEFHVFRPNQGILPDQEMPPILPEWIFYYIRRKSFREAAKRSFRGAVGQQRVPEDFFYNQKIPVPYPDQPSRSLAEQHRIVAYLDAVREEIRAMSALLEQDEQAVEELEQSILAAAFRGEV